jgi:mannose-6-phosphate isomerase
MDSGSAILPAFEELRSWFLDQALPLWSRNGVDRQAGGFFEKLHPNLQPTAEPRRARLVARQIYWFAAGGELGWQGPVDELIHHGFQFLTRHLISCEGEVRASCAADGGPLDIRQHLYDVAFVLLALAKIAKRRSGSAEMQLIARSIVGQLSPHPLGGYIDEITPEMQCANPHMHLFEAFLAWTTVPGATDCFWSHRAAALASLAMDRMIQPDIGALPEHFDHSWRPLQKGGYYRIEPGHQFEWSWLLGCWAQLSGDARAVAASSRLCRLAENYGVDQERNVAIECITDQLLPFEHTARLWQQSERLKAWHYQTRNINGSTSASFYRNLALGSLLRFLSGPQPGLWFDEMDQNAKFVVQPVKASSGYHIACAIEVLSDGFSCR